MSRVIQDTTDSQFVSQNDGTQYEVSACNNGQEWDRFVEQHTRDVYYFWRWKQVVENSFGHATHYLKATNPEGEIEAVLPLVELKSRMFGHFALSLPFVNYGGILSNNDVATSSLVDHCDQLGKSLGLSHILLRQDKESTIPWHCDDHKITMILDLPEDPDILWKQIGSKRRAQVKRPLKEGATVSSGGVELLDDFYAVFSQNMRDLGTPVYGRAWFENILTLLSGESQLVVVYLSGKPVAAGLLIRHGDRMEIPWASSLREANRFGVNMLLYWEVLKLSIEQQCKFFDFGRSSKDASTYRFKKQWGSEPRQLYWYNWTADGAPPPRLDPNNSKYAKAIAIWQRLPLPVANFLGPYIVKYLP